MKYPKKIKSIIQNGIETTTPNRMVQEIYKKTGLVIPRKELENIKKRIKNERNLEIEKDSNFCMFHEIQYNRTYWILC